ncbi:hypothetical protein O5D80_001913 [Batrachochytrium dendrobatidis]|nr:hypothetical protein O5D80_001913 [Batrachochytrium dendrobatidis]
MARDYLAIPVTSASSEHAFSKARHLITDSRTRLSDQTIRAIICLENWSEVEFGDLSYSMETVSKGWRSGIGYSSRF